MLRLINPASLVRRAGYVVRNISTYPEDSTEQMTITDDGKVIVCWHPEKTFPYECSKPLPPEKAESTWLFNMDPKEVHTVFKSKKPEQMREELAKMTYTCKHRFFPRARDRKAKKTPMNRPYL